MNVALERAASELSGFHAPWGVAGGWALDLFVGEQSRAHADVDIAVLRADQQQLRSQLTGHVEKVVEGQLADWTPAEVLTLPTHEVHVTWPDGYHLEVLMNEQNRETNEWVFRRDARVRRPMRAAFVLAPIPYLAPEIVLLYKSKDPAVKDNADFRFVFSHLDSDRRAWLRQALNMTAPGHPWATALSGSDGRQL